MVVQENSSTAEIRKQAGKWGDIGLALIHHNLQTCGFRFFYGHI